MIIAVYLQRDEFLFAYQVTGAIIEFSIQQHKAYAPMAYITFLEANDTSNGWQVWSLTQLHLCAF